MAAKTEPAANPAERALLLTRVFDGPRQIVFKAWTDPGYVALWWGPHGFTNPRSELDARPGGAMYIDMRGPDGSRYLRCSQPSPLPRMAARQPSHCMGASFRRLPKPRHISRA